MYIVQLAPDLSSVDRWFYLAAQCLVYCLVQFVAVCLYISGPTCIPKNKKHTILVIIIFNENGIKLIWSNTQIGWIGKCSAAAN